MNFYYFCPINLEFQRWVRQFSHLFQPNYQFLVHIFIHRSIRNSSIFVSVTEYELRRINWNLFFTYDYPVIKSILTKVFTKCHKSIDTAINMEPESVLIIATVFVLINTGVVLVCELFRDSTADTVLRDTISRSTFFILSYFIDRYRIEILMSM